MLKEIRQLGFPVVELSHAIRFSLWPGIVRAWEEDLIRIQTLHNFCPVPTSVFRPNPNAYEFSDPRPSIRAAAVKATEETIRHAAKFGARAVICHLGSAGPKGITDQLEKIFAKGGYLNRHYCDLKVKAVRKRKETFTVIWPRIKECLDPLVGAGGRTEDPSWLRNPPGVRGVPARGGISRSCSSPIPPEVVGYWHDFGHPQSQGVSRLARPRRDPRPARAAAVWRPHSRLPPPSRRPSAPRPRRNCIHRALAPDAGKRYRCIGAGARYPGRAGDRQPSFMEFLRRRIGLIFQALVSALIIAWLIRIVDWRTGVVQRSHDGCRGGSWRRVSVLLPSC